jgi:Nuclease-related domain
MGGPMSRKRLHLCRADRCSVCDRELALGAEAFWYPVPRTVTCLGCDPGEAAVVEGHAGASALREHERAGSAVSSSHAGGSAVAAAPSSPAWPMSRRPRGPGTRVATARSGPRRASPSFYAGRASKLLHDRRIPDHGNANIDHIAIGPGGVTVIDTKTHRGKVRVERIGGLFSARRSVLRIAGRDRTSLIDRVERQIERVRAALNLIAEDRIDVRGALCFANVDGLPILAHLSVREIIIDGTRPVAKLAGRPGPLNPETIDRIWKHLGHSLTRPELQRPQTASAPTRPITGRLSARAGA